MRKALLLVLVCFSLSSLMAQVERTKIAQREKDNPSVNIVAGEVTETTIEVSFNPNTACAYYDFVAAPQGNMQSFAAGMGTTVDALVTQWGIQQSGNYTHLYDGMEPKTTYTIFARPYDSDGNPFPLDSINVVTLGFGGEGLSLIEVELNGITDTSVVMKATPNAETAVFFDGLITLEYFNEIGADSAISVIQNSPYPQYEVDEWNWVGLTPKTQYKAIAIGKNALDEWGEATIKDFTTLSGIGVQDMQNKTLEIYPQPNNGQFVINSDDVMGKVLTIFDISGKVVYQEKLQENNPQIDLKQLSEGQYFLQIEKGKSATKLLIVK